jgi:hypothetical protein
VKYRLFHVLLKWQKFTLFFVRLTKFTQHGKHPKKYVQVEVKHSKYKYYNIPDYTAALPGDLTELCCIDTLRVSMSFGPWTL